jgi:hypothetical protein
MKLEILPLEEVTDIDENRRLVRYKRARFKVDGREHTLRISLPDFNAGKWQELVKKEAELIAGSSSKK